MARKDHKPEEIVTKLRKVEVLVSQGKPVAEAIRVIGVTEPTYYRWLTGVLAVAQIAAAPLATTSDRNVFVGAVAGFCPVISSPAIFGPMVATGRIGLYEHANGLANCTASERGAMRSAWTATGAGENRSVGEVGGTSGAVPPSYISLFDGRYPLEVNVNALGSASAAGRGTYTTSAANGDKSDGRRYTSYVSAADLVELRSNVESAIGAGAKNVAIVSSPNSGAEDLDDAFATSPYWFNVRAAALYGGAIALDTPPSYWLSRGAKYWSMIDQMVGWGVAQHIRVSMIVSPFNTTGHGATLGGCAFDAKFIENLVLLVQHLQPKTMPTQWIVENYGEASKACEGSENGFSSGGDPTSLNAAALYLAALTSTSAPGTSEPAAPGGARDAGLQVYLGN